VSAFTRPPHSYSDTIGKGYILLEFLDFYFFYVGILMKDPRYVVEHTRNAILFYVNEITIFFHGKPKLFRLVAILAT
jgi:hypothetical protein